MAQISGGIASAIAGMIVFQTSTGHIENYPVLGSIVTVTMIITILMMHIINKEITLRQDEEKGLQAATA